MSELKFYNLRFELSNPVFNDVLNYKKLFIKQFGLQMLSKSKPHITIAAFKMFTEYEDLLVKYLNQLTSIKKFKIDINGFDIFDNSQTLILKVLLSNEIIELHTLLKTVWIRDLHRKMSSILISNAPHITISKTQGKQMLYESLEFFKKMDYFKQIEISQLSLVSRYERKTWDWEHKMQLA